MSPDELRDSSVLADELRAAWEAGDAIPDLAVLLCGSGGLSAEQLTELCLTDQSYRWRTPEPLRVEDYLAACPAIARQPELVLELAYGEIRTRQRLGQPPTACEIEARFPDLASRLHEQLEVGFWMDEGAASPTPAMAVPPICAMHRSGRFGPYELGEAIAHGGMGVVFRSRDLRLNRVVALNVIRPDRVAGEADLRRFHNETLTIARLDHPHIVPIYDVGEVDGVHYFTMRLMEGGELQQQCRRYLNDPRAAAQVVVDVAEAVHHAHQCGVLHRDVKPSNVLLDEAGRPHITDFGLARRLDDETPSTEAGKILGTPAYLAPERLLPGHSPLTVAADVYGLGALLYVRLTEKPPFEAKHLLEVLESVRHREPAPPRRLNPRVDRDLEQICLKAIAKRPADRYAGAQDLAEDLQRFLAGKAVRARPLAWWQRRWRWARRHPDLAILGGTMPAAAAVLLTLLGLQTTRLGQTRRSLDNSLQAVRGQRAEAEANWEEAARLRQAAEELKMRAEGAYAEAVAQGLLARRTAYAAAIHHVEMAPRPGDTTEFSRLLDEQVPGAGQGDVRGFEWFLLERLYRPRAERFPLLAGHVRSVCYSPDESLLAAAPDGQWLIGGDRDGNLKIWNPASRQAVYEFAPPTKCAIMCLSVSFDGTHVAAGDSDYRVQVARLRRPWAHEWVLAGQHFDRLQNLTFSSDGRRVACRDKIGSVRIWRLDGGAAGDMSAPLPPERAWQAHQGRGYDVAFAPQHDRLATVGQENEVAVWELRGSENVLSLGESGRVSSPVCSLACRLGNGGIQWFEVSKDKKGPVPLLEPSRAKVEASPSPQTTGRKQLTRSRIR